MASNAEHLRRWLAGCPALAEGAPIGVDYLGDEPGARALIALPSALRWVENVLGQRKAASGQARDFILAFREPHGADAARGLENLALCRAVADWIAARNAAGDFPQWEGGAVTGVTPATTGGAVAWGAGMARYQLQIRVNYEISQEENDYGE